MAKAGFIHSHLAKATRSNRPIVVQGLDEKLKDYYDNWQRLEEYLVSQFQKEQLNASEISSQISLLVTRSKQDVLDAIKLCDEESINRTRQVSLAIGATTDSVKSLIELCERLERAHTIHFDATTLIGSRMKDQMKQTYTDIQNIITFMSDDIHTQMNHTRTLIKYTWLGLTVLGLGISTLLWVCI